MSLSMHWITLKSLFLVAIVIPILLAQSPFAGEEAPSAEETASAPTIYLTIGTNTPDALCERTHLKESKNTFTLDLILMGSRPEISVSGTI
jgi:hypothetical protein